jgi:hypothetical protein
VALGKNKPALSVPKIRRLIDCLRFIMVIDSVF